MNKIQQKQKDVLTQCLLKLQEAEALSDYAFSLTDGVDTALLADGDSQSISSATDGVKECISFIGATWEIEHSVGDK